MQNKKAEIRLKLIKVTQNSNEFYIGKMKATDLIRISTIHWRDSGESKENKYLDEVRQKLNVVESENGIQRIIQKKRLKEIAEYLASENGLLPNSIIVSLNNKWINDDIEDNFQTNGFEAIELDEDLIELRVLDPDLVDAFIVDGQHRLASFGYTDDLAVMNNYELVVTIFLDLEIPIQAEIFSIINGKQRPVNKSLLYDLSAFKDDEYNEIKRCHSIVKWLDNNTISPFYNEVKMLGTGVGSISQSAFIDELVRYVKERTSNKQRSFLRDKGEKEIIQIILSYFKAVEEVFNKQWNDKEYVLKKTTGFGALMKLMYYIYMLLYVKGQEFKRSNIKNVFQAIDPEIFSVKKIGKGGSQGVQVQLYKEMVNVIVGNDEAIKKLENQFKKKFL
ncbi:DGQHR domain-containing protein [Alkalihalobacterium elongatum]|uniref:DGQHR domain-containing protein n=1 Tax=Alkalihalobacterium elongatum TaxID=2675466 RepID=UPI001C1F2A8B|nr:DGQHR domain-containing protein [Alkalihalobacterium elongatum]